MPLNDRTVSASMLPLPLLQLDTEGQVMFANELALHQFGMSSRKIAGLHLTRLLSPRSDIELMMQRVLDGETISGANTNNAQTNDPCSLHMSPSPEGVLVLLVPEAARKEIELQAHRQDMAEAVARIALEMAHEVKNPLASLRGAAQWLSESASDDSSREISLHMLSEVDRIRERIDSFLQLGPRADINMQPINIHALIDEVCQPPAGVNLRRVYDPSLPPLLAHASRLRQAIENLWSNALEAGSTHIEWQTRIAPMVRLPGHHRGAVLEVRITSDGSPIPEQLREHLFEPFVTGKQRGSGLGLAIVQRVMQEHGGRISLKSVHNRTSFILHLPIRDAGQAKS